jgi:uncharacterized iron-regulated protein
MLPASDQDKVDQALIGRPGKAELAERLDWRARGWPAFSLYWPLFELALEQGLRVVAADLEPALARRIGREGIRALGDRGEGLSSLLPPDPAREAALARTIQQAHCDLLPRRSLPFMVESWHARNVAMARRLADTLRDVQQVVVIVGRGHQEAGGLPDQLAALRHGTRQFVVDMLEVAPGQSPQEVASAGSGDVVWLAPEAKRPDPCEGLRRRLRKHEEMAVLPPAPGAGRQRAPAPW